MVKLNISVCKIVSYRYAKSSLNTEECEFRYFEQFENVKDLGVIFNSTVEYPAIAVPVLTA